MLDNSWRAWFIEFWPLVVGFIVVSTHLILTNEGQAHLLFGALQPRIFAGFQRFEITSSVYLLFLSGN
jgi:hypothetical protein